MLLFLLAQAAQLPDIQLDLRVSAREATVRERGEASLEVRGGPGSDVRVEKPQGDGRRRLRNVDVRVQAEARVADPGANREAAETPAPQ